MSLFNIVHKHERPKINYNLFSLDWFGTMAARNRYRFLSKFVKDKSVLDIACGEGIGLGSIVDGGAKKVVALDRSKSLIKRLNKSNKDPKIKFVYGDVGRKIKLGKKFDLIIAAEIIEHLQDHKKVISNIKRLKKKDGVAFITTPNKRIKNRVGINFVHHVREYNTDELKKILEKQFRVVELYRQFYFYKKPKHKMMTSILKMPLNLSKVKKAEKDLTSINNIFLCK